MTAETGDKTLLPLYDVMVGIYVTVPPLEQFVVRHLGETLDQLTPPGDLKQRLFKLVEWCRQRGKGPDVVKALFSEHGGNPEVRALHARFFPGSAVGVPVSAASAFARHCLGEDLVFINRKGLRKALQAIESGSGRNVLVVSGGSGTGKTFTYRLILHGAKQYAYQLVWVNLREELLPGAGPDALAKAVLHQMAISPEGLPPQGPQNAARWAPEIASWMVGKMRAAQQQQKWWLVIDGIDRDATSEELRMLLTHLAAKMEPTLPNVRLCLLGYDEPPGRLLTPANARYDSTSSIGRADLENFFLQAYKEFGQTASPEVTTATVDGVPEALPGQSYELRQLHDLVCAALQSLFMQEAA